MLHAQPSEEFTNQQVGADHPERPVIPSLAQVIPPHIHFVFTRSYRSVLPALLTFMLASILVLPLSEHFPRTLLHFSFALGEQQYLISMPILCLLAAVLLMRPLFLMYDATHTITPHHVRSTLGRCSLRRVDIEVAYEDVRGVSISQSLLERMLGVGTLHVWTAINASPEISMRGIAQLRR